MLRKSELRKAGRRNDNRSTKTIEDAGWDVARVGPRYVASKRVIEDDHTITMRYESDYQIGDLSRRVVRREQEGA
jgi:hypothetical protein